MAHLDDFDLDDLTLDPREEAQALARLRRDKPVHRDPRSGHWLLLRHADVLEVSRHPETFSSEPNGPWHAFTSHFSMQAQDGPLHHAVRNVVSRGFTPRRVRALEARARRYTDECLDAIASAGRGDLVRDLALPVPMRIIADMLGLEGADLDLFERWTLSVEQALAGGPGRTDTGAICAEFAARLREVVAERSAHPRDDLISTMLGAGDRAVFEPFRRDPFPGVDPGDGVMGFVAFLVLAGSETTRHAIAQGMRALIEHPEQRARLIQRPALLTRAVEEILRWTSPVRAMRRTLLRDAELRGHQLRAGESVVMIYPSANRDEAVFESPQSFRVDRRPNEHLSFGMGTHFCLGANLARMEIRVAVGRLLERLPDLELAPGTRPERAFSPIINGLVSMPVVFTPVPRAA
jgi:cytochrome P450 family 142 subfamily A polypeptide 1